MQLTSSACLHHVVLMYRLITLVYDAVFYIPCWRVPAIPYKERRVLCISLVWNSYFGRSQFLVWQTFSYLWKPLLLPQRGRICEGQNLNLSRLDQTEMASELSEGKRV